MRVTSSGLGKSGPRKSSGVTVRRVACGLAVLFLFSGMASANSAFPYGQELMLDAHPMKGSKRVPLLDIEENGSAQIDLWCNSVRAQAVIARNSITITPGEKTDRQCEPERMQGDDDMLSALSEVNSWRLEGDTLILIGTHTIKFRLETN
jgi:heat shock protein HslJ